MRRAALTVLAAALLASASCSVPGDPNHYEWADTSSAGDAPTGGDTDARPSAPSLGLACDQAHPCGGGLDCRVPAECRRTDSAVVTPPEAVGGRAGDRCDDGRPCAEGLTCEPLSEVGRCTSECAADADCPAAAVCWLARGPAQGWCVPPGGLLGAACELETDCAPGLFCENRAQGGYCAKACDAGVPCPSGMSAICTRLSGDFGIYCLQRCTDDHASCRADVECRKMAKADEYVCFPSF